MQPILLIWWQHSLGYNVPPKINNQITPVPILAINSWSLLIDSPSAMQRWLIGKYAIRISVTCLSVHGRLSTRRHGTTPNVTSRDETGGGRSAENISIVYSWK